MVATMSGHPSFEEDHTEHLLRFFAILAERLVAK